MKTRLLIPVLFLAAAVHAAPPKKEEGIDPNKPVSFYKNIRPIFQAQCNGCHQPAKKKGDYIMTEFVALLKGGEEGHAVVPGNPAESNLLKLIKPDEKGKVEMPQKAEPLHETQIALIERWIDDLALSEPPLLVGHSLGAAIALRFAINYRQELAGIVLVGGGMKMPVNPFFLEFLKTNPPIVPSEVIDLICKYSLAKENRPKFFAPLQKSISQSKVDVLYGDLLACNNLDLIQELGKIRVPALVICGAEDKMTPPDCSRQLAASISGAKLEIIEGAGHMVMLERPVEFNMSLDKFAESISGAVSRKG